MRGLRVVSDSLSVAGKWQQQLLRRFNFHEYQVYLCEKLSLVNEMYFALTLDRKTRGPFPINVFTGITNEDAAKVVDDGLALKAAAMEQMKKLYSDYTLVELGAKAVNRVAGDNPADVFANIAKRVHEIMLRDADKDPAIEPSASQAKLLLLNQVYLCEKLSLVNEMYFALPLDPKTGDPVPIDVFTGITNEDALKVIDGGLALKAAAVDQMKKLYNLSSQSDYTLLETNPPAETSDNQLVAADAYVNFEDNALCDTSEEDSDPHEGSDEEFTIIAPDTFSVEIIEPGVLRAPKWIHSWIIEEVGSLRPNMKLVLHTDASMYQDVEGDWVATIGIVCRDIDTGELIWYATGACDVVSPDSNVCELAGMLYGSYLARCLGIDRILLKCDSKDAVEIIDKRLSEIRNNEILPIYLGFQRLRQEGMKIHPKHITDEWEKKAADELSRVERYGGGSRKDAIAKFLRQVRIDKKEHRKID